MGPEQSGSPVHSIIALHLGHGFVTSFFLFVSDMDIPLHRIKYRKCVRVPKSMSPVFPREVYSFCMIFNVQVLSELFSSIFSVAVILMLNEAMSVL